MERSPIHLIRSIGNSHRLHVKYPTYFEYPTFKILGARFTGAFVREVFVHIDTIEYYVTDSAKLYSDLHIIAARQNDFSSIQRERHPFLSTMTYAMD